LLSGRQLLLYVADLTTQGGLENLHRPHLPRRP
jgi:hypothetical protein